MTERLIGTWGCVHSPEGAIPEDRGLFERERLSGVTMPCVAQDEGSLTLDCRGAFTVRVLPGSFVPRETPDFVWGQPVRITAKGVDATVSEICWHGNEGRYFYHVVDTDGRRLKKRYWAEELEGRQPWT